MSVKLSDLYHAFHAHVHPGTYLAIEWVLVQNSLYPVAALLLVVPVQKGAANDN